MHLRLFEEELVRDRLRRRVQPERAPEPGRDDEWEPFESPETYAPRPATTDETVLQPVATVPGKPPNPRCPPVRRVAVARPDSAQRGREHDRVLEAPGVRNSHGPEHDRDHARTRRRTDPRVSQDPEDGRYEEDTNNKPPRPSERSTEIARRQPQQAVAADSGTRRTVMIGSRQPPDHAHVLGEDSIETAAGNAMRPAPARRGSPANDAHDQHGPHTGRHDPEPVEEAEPPTGNVDHREEQRESGGCAAVATRFPTSKCNGSMNPSPPAMLDPTPANHTASSSITVCGRTKTPRRSGSRGDGRNDGPSVVPLRDRGLRRRRVENHRHRFTATRRAGDPRRPQPRSGSRRPTIRNRMPPIRRPCGATVIPEPGWEQRHPPPEEPTPRRRPDRAQPALPTRHAQPFTFASGKEDVRWTSTAQNPNVRPGRAATTTGPVERSRRVRPRVLRDARRLRTRPPATAREPPAQRPPQPPTHAAERVAAALAPTNAEGDREADRVLEPTRAAADGHGPTQHRRDHGGHPEHRTGAPRSLHARRPSARAGPGTAARPPPARGAATTTAALKSPRGQVRPARQRRARTPPARPRSRTGPRTRGPRPGREPTETRPAPLRPARPGARRGHARRARAARRRPPRQARPEPAQQRRPRPRAHQREAQGRAAGARRGHAPTRDEFSGQAPSPA